MKAPRLLVSAAHKSSGKTTLTLGLAAALSARGRTVQTFKKGPDYIDPMWLARASGRACFNLDPHLMTADEVAGLFAQGVAGADIALVEGNKGLYDGLALDGSNSNAALAHQLHAPVLLVLDARGMTRGIAPLILGYQAFDRGLHIGGVILNQLGGARHEAKLRAVIEHYTDVPVLGALQRDDALLMPERHLGLTPVAELDDARTRVQAIAQAVAAQVDLDRVQALAETAPALTPALRPTRPATPATPAGTGRRVRIALARDRAFGFYYADDLAALEAAGATLLPFDTLHDNRLPVADGMFIGGGFPETCLRALHANAPMRAALHEAVTRGLPTYAECGGLMLLARSIRQGELCLPMAGVIPGDVVMHARPVGRGYMQLQETAAMPWSPPTSEPFGAHEFHHSSLENLDPGLPLAYRVQRGHGIDGRGDGIVLHKLLASYAHRRQVGADRWAERFVDFVRRESAPRAQAPRSPARAAA